jgi:PKD repeat protein
MAPGFSAKGYAWSDICSNSAGTNDWTAIDEFSHGGQCLYHGLWGNGCTAVPNPPVAVKVLNIASDHMNRIANGGTISHPCSPLVDETNTLSSWVQDVALIYSNAAARYTTNFIYEILNEPNYANVIFPTNQDPYNSGGAYPASLAVSASVQAIESVCPTCQTWAPAATGLRGNLSLFTNSFVVAGYTNVNTLSFHGGDMLYGPIDATLAHTSAVLVAMGGGSTWWPTDSNEELVAEIYGKPFAITEAYPFSPDALGKTNSWWATQAGLFAPAYTSLPWTWQTMAFRFWKNLIEWRSTGVSRIQTWLQIYDYDVTRRHPPSGYYGQDAYCGWDSGGETGDVQGCGPLPSVDGEAMISWWLNNGTPLANWLSGGPLTVVDPLGGYTNGTPGLHFWAWQFADGSTNTFVWADEQITVSTNFGVGLTDIFSNQWTGPIGMEPVIAWGWPNNSLGGSFSIVPVAAFSATPTNGPAPMTVTFTDGSAGAITSRSWQFGDGFVTNTPQPTVVHQYTAPGTNTVQLIVSGPSGASTYAQTNMVVVGPFSPSQNNGGSNNVPPVTGGSGGGTNNVLPTDGVASSNWRFLITY